MIDLHALLLVLQAQVHDWRPVDILVTSLLTLVTGIVTWILRTVLRHQDDNVKFGMTLYGVDGKNGHSSAIRALKAAVEILGDEFSDISHDIKAIKRHVGMTDDFGPRRKQRHRDPEDAEDDRRG